MEKKTLSVTGEAQLSFAPDTIAVMVDYKKTNLSYDASLDGVNQMTCELKKQAVSSGLKENDVKTLDYKIHPTYSSERDARGNYHDVFKGYEAKASFEISFPLDNKKLNSLIQNISASENEIRFEYRLSNVEDCRDKVIQEATKSAIHKAGIIAKASKIRLGSILNVNYSYGIIRFEDDDSYSISMDSHCMYSPSILEITPADKKLNDHVTITWEIQE